LEHANDDQGKIALHHVLSDPRTQNLETFLSQKKRVEPRTILGQEIDYWTSPAIIAFFTADNERLGGGSSRIGATTDPVTERKEQLNRTVQATLRGQQETYQLWGIAIDAGLEIADEVGTAVPFIMATFFKDCPTWPVSTPLRRWTSSCPLR
jgi:hypothetical protein